MDGITIFRDALLHHMHAFALRLQGSNLSQYAGSGRRRPGKTLPLYAVRVSTTALVLVATCMVPDSGAQTAVESIAVPSHTKLLLQAVGRGDQVYGCVNGSWELKAPDAELLNQEGSVIGRHFGGPTWRLSDGSWVKGKVVAEHAAPDATAVPWLLLESTGGTGKLKTVRFIQRAWTHGGSAPQGGCSANAMHRVPYSAAYSFYEVAQ